MSNFLSINSEHIQDCIFTIRNLQIILDRDLAELYQVPVKVLNQAVKRSIERFPDRFRFQLSETERIELVTNCDRFERLKHSSVNPFAFTEQGVSMLSAVLRSNTAIQVSIGIMDAFQLRLNFSKSRDRFIIIDNESIYHFGESLKDLGKK